MPNKDPYSILGLQKNASEDEIKRAYRKMAQKHHPDRNKGDKASEEKFKEINGAYEILGDKKKRQTYDQFGDSAFTGGNASSQGGFSGGGFDFSGFQDAGGGFSDIFETFFGGHSQQRSRNQEQSGDDREISITVTFEEAAFGVEKELRINRIGECETCNGKGMAPGSKLITCKTCGGVGEIKSVRSTILGQVAVRRVCDDCAGKGRVPENKCQTCHGVGRMRVVEQLKIKIPAGIGDGSTMRIAGKGDAGLRGGEAGDLYTHIRVATHKKFSRRDSDVYSTQTIHLIQAVLGDTITVETIQGPVAMRIPAGIESGKVFKLVDFGIKKLKENEKGDHYVTINVLIPKKLSKREKELYENLAKEANISLTEDKGFFKKMMGE